MDRKTIFINLDDAIKNYSSLIDTLTYRNYAYNRDIAPDKDPKDWEKIYGPKAKDYEKLYQTEREAENATR